MSKPSENRYYLNIHHRSIAINIDQDSGMIEQSFSPGQFYVSLQKDEVKQYFGKYPQSSGVPGMLLGKEVISLREEELQRK